MILLLDAGNTRLKWGCRDASGWVAQGALPAGETHRLVEVVATHSPDWVGVCCVAGEATRRGIERVLADRATFWLQPPAEGNGVVNRYEVPGSLGADRYAGLVACARGGLAPCVLASAGTALTVDALTGEGEFLGGMILPGAGLMRDALIHGTGGVRFSGGAWRDYPRATGDAVETGILTAMAGAVEAMRQRLAGTVGRGVGVVLTGGDADWLSARLSGAVTVDRNLVLEGLSWLARDMGVADV